MQCFRRLEATLSDDGSVSLDLVKGPIFFMKVGVLPLRMAGYCISIGGLIPLPAWKQQMLRVRFGCIFGRREKFTATLLP